MAQAQPVKGVLRSLDIPQKRLAAVLHVSEATASRLLSGLRTPSVEHASAVAAYLDLPEATLWRPERRPSRSGL